jgi:hypothetical protein
MGVGRFSRCRLVPVLKVSPVQPHTAQILTLGNPDLDERLLLFVHPWLPPPFPGPGGPKTPLYL